ncbi:hypothetical protein MH215_01420 [Paenibacillus sp. ACRSA]|uniref:hypothetical protein n=1 Tax=Paenibacillus sp. ACRSA TaxID=2918211 RepID=UPI001EF550FD|nr:hypothetical protein [Paenibacillus sp. ACRSA]MCG7375635.1 hypothetical protein [Paenibacillus sp. ACRSA]
MKRRIILGCVALVLVFMILFVWLYPFPQKMNRQSDVVVLNEDHVVLGNTTLVMEGTVHRPLFREHYFEGKIELSDLDFTREYRMFPLYPVQEGNIFSSFITYSGSSQQLESVTGVMFHDDSFLKLNLFLKEAPYKGTTHNLIQIVSPASDLMTAEKIVNELKLGFPDMPDAKKLLPPQ